jgi:hypothetical protein
MFDPNFGRPLAIRAWAAIAAMGAFACARAPIQPAPAALEPAPTILHFPQDESLGLIYSRAADSDDAWIALTDARGAVVRPESAELAWVALGAKQSVLAALDALTTHALAALDLRYIAIDDGDLARIARRRSLRGLTLAGPGVTDSGLPRLASLERLEFLALIDTGTTRLGALKLHAVLPDCRIGYTPRDPSDAAFLIDPSDLEDPPIDGARNEG